MDKVRLLCEKDSEMLQEFSRRSLHAVPGGAFLSLFSSYLERNVKKEIDKDRLVIQEAAAAFAARRPACDLDLEELFEKTKKVDKDFIEGLSIPSFTLTVRYSDFADIRIQRIWQLCLAVYAVLRKWPQNGSFRDAVRSAYTREEFQKMIIEILHLYTLETRMLGDSIHSPFHGTIAQYCETLYTAMESVLQELAESYTRTLFGDKPIHA